MFARTTAGGAGRFAWALLALMAAGVPLLARADDGGETVARPRYALVPAYVPGEQFRVERHYHQSTFTGIHDSPRNPKPAVDPFSYDASMEVEALVTVEKVDARGGAEVWSARIDKMRVDIPDPIQTQEYRLRLRENKQKRLPRTAHPLEGSTVKVDQSGEKMRLFKVLASGEDAGISQRYPEVLPLMQDLVDPDWSPVDSVPVGGEWEMNADHIFRLTRVLAKSPLKGTIRCRLASVANGMATVAFTSTLKETYATIEMKIELSGRIEFDVQRRRQVGSSYKGEVQISAKGSSLQGRGTLEGGSEFTVAVSVPSPEGPK